MKALAFYILYQPIYNSLIVLTIVLPFHDLGTAIILLTLIIKFILLVPSQRALKAQKRLQEIQPHIDELKKKHEGNQQKIAEETMKIWKEYKVNPFTSCLTTLIQIPILFALFYVLRDGLNPDKINIVYPFLRSFSLEHINIYFFGFLNLTKPETTYLPITIGVLQYLQMVTLQTKKKKTNQEDKTKKEDKKPAPGEMPKILNYAMPIFIAMIARNFSAGLGLYWATTTLFTLVQQLIVNKQFAHASQKSR